MRKSILKLGNALNKVEQKEINGKSSWFYEICLLRCEKQAERHPNFPLENCYSSC